MCRFDEAYPKAGDSDGWNEGMKTVCEMLPTDRTVCTDPHHSPPPMAGYLVAHPPGTLMAGLPSLIDPIRQKTSFFASWWDSGKPS